MVASIGKRAANVFMSPFSGPELRGANRVIRELEDLCGLSAEDRRRGWGLQLVAQVGQVADPFPIERPLARKLGANLLSLRSERIQPGVNMEDKAPGEYRGRHVVPDELAVMAGARPSTLASGGGGARCGQVHDGDGAGRHAHGRRQGASAPDRELGDITDQLVDDLPRADLPTGRVLSKAPAAAGPSLWLDSASIRWTGSARCDAEGRGLGRAVRAAGAAASRSALPASPGLIDLPESTDLLTGCCLMAGPVNQNDIGEQYYGYPDLLAGHTPGATPCRCWCGRSRPRPSPIQSATKSSCSTLPARALVDLRCGPHEAVWVVDNDGARRPMRKEGDRVSQERAFSDVGNLPERQTARPFQGMKVRRGPVGMPASGCKRGLGRSGFGRAHRRRMSGFTRPCAADAPTGCYSIVLRTRWELSCSPHPGWSLITRIEWDLSFSDLPVRPLEVRVLMADPAHFDVV